MIIAMTGHRPQRIVDEVAVRGQINNFFKQNHPELVIQGMANGVDVWSAAEAWKNGIPYLAVLPWSTHKNTPTHVYDWVLRNAQKKIIVNEVTSYPGAWVFQKRNEWMVDHADTILAVWDKKPYGGTYNAIKYAKKFGKDIFVISVDGSSVEKLEY